MKAVRSKDGGDKRAVEQRRRLGDLKMGTDDDDGLG